MRFAKLLFPCLLLAMMVGCKNDLKNYQSRLRVVTGPAPSLTFLRYEEVLFQLDTARFQEELLAIQPDYLPFLAGDLSDPDAVRYLKEFAIDTFSVQLYAKVKDVYPDLNEVQKQVSAVYRHFNYYYPEVELPRKIYTCVSGVNPEIPPVMLVDDAVVVSLDWYLDRDSIYDRMGMPKYRSERTTKNSLSKDFGAMLYADVLSCRHQQTNIVEEMVFQGRALFFIEALCPDIDDETLLGYSKEQLQWAESNEGNLWADIVGSQCLYSTEYDWFKTFFSDGPFTHEYSYDAPSRLGEFVGLHIIRSFFSSHDVSLQQLMESQDLQALFQESGYKPKK